MLAWSDDYKVEIKEIDEQHKKIIGLINTLYQRITKREQASATQAVIDELLDETRIHFAVEESLLRLFDYHGYEEHKAIHDGIIERVTNFQERFRAGDQRVAMELVYFLTDRLKEHIDKVDKQYAPYLSNEAVGRRRLKKFFRNAAPVSCHKTEAVRK